MSEQGTRVGVGVGIGAVAAVGYALAVWLARQAVRAERAEFPVR